MSQLSFKLSFKLSLLSFKLSHLSQLPDANVSHCRTVKAMEGAAPHLSNVQDLLKHSIFLGQQLKYEQVRVNRFCT